MQHIIEKITHALLQKLPPDRPFYTLKELDESEIPSYVIDRVEVELRRNLAESIQLPETDWATMSDRNVQISWNKFLKAIHDQVHLPKSFAKSVFEASVADIVDVMLQPRTMIPEILFAGQVSLSYDQLVANASQVTIYPYLIQALIRYMEKRDLETMTREKATTIIEKIDEKITSHYTPLNWAQLLQPWFELLPSGIDNDLFRVFFEDKQQTYWAEKFSDVSNSFSRTDFIEFLSQPDFPKLERGETFAKESTSPKIESKQPSLSELSPEEEVTNNSSEEVVESTSTVSSPFSELSSFESEPQLSDENEHETELKPTVESEIRPSSVPSSTSEETFTSEDEEGEKSLADRFFQPEEIKTTTNLFSKEEVDEEEDDLEDVPIWKRFVEVEEDTSPPKPRVTFKEIRDALNEHQTAFVRALFEGDEDTYVQTLQRLSEFTEWRKTTAYLVDEVFRPNNIDLYSEEVIDFLDRLQPLYQKH